MEMDLTHEKCLNYSGWLKKKSSNLIGGWQKRFFQILEGKMMVYSDNEHDQKPKGHMLFSDIGNAVSTEKKVFKFKLNERDYILEAKDEQLKNEWIYVINYLIQFNNTKKKELTFKSKISYKDDLPMENEADPGRNEKKKAYQKMKSLDKKSLELLHNHGMIASEDGKLSEKILIDKKIGNFITVNHPDIKTRFHYGLLFKKHKTRDCFKKRWFFIFSSRPLSDQLYEKDDLSLEKNKLKGWMKFDCLFIFKYEKENEQLEPVSFLDLSNSHMIETMDKDGKYYMILDVQDRKHEFYSEIKGERDQWFEVLKNSRRTAKDIKASISKYPRNIHKLANILSEHNHNKLMAEFEKEKKQIIGDYTQIKDFETLAFIISSLEKEMISTIDGCISTNPPNTELLQIYTENFNTTYLTVIQHFWANQYSQLDNTNLIKLSSILFSFEQKLFTFRINDPNFGKNARELMKIFTRKTFKNCIDLISNILKIEREVKSVKSGDEYFITNGPIDLFDILLKIFDLVKGFKHHYIHILMLRMFNECFIQYLIGLDCVVSNNLIIVEHNFLLAVANNSITFIENLTRLIDDWEKLNILNKKEIIEAICLNEIMHSIHIMSQNAVRRFVADFAIKISESFNTYYLDLDIQKVLMATHQIFGPFNKSMNTMIIKKVYEEILKLTAFYYIKLLLTDAHKKVKKVDELSTKINEDKDLLFETYETVVGKNLTEANLKIFSDIHDFLEISSYLISSSCQTLREYMGSSFNLGTVKALINLRCDFTKEEKKEVIKECKEILDKFVDKSSSIGKRDRGFFDKMEKEIRAENEDPNDDLNLEMEEDSAKKSENEKVYFSLEEFLKEKTDDEHNEEEKEIDDSINISQEDEMVSDVIYQGTMTKKTYSTWQERFFQLKNGYLYWFKDKSSVKIQNKISLELILRVESLNNYKFLIVTSDQENLKPGKVYKFRLGSDKEKEGWIYVITQEMKKIKGEAGKSLEMLIEMKCKKKMINDYYKLPEMGRDRSIFKDKIISTMKNENYFKPQILDMETTTTLGNLIPKKEQEIPSDNCEDKSNEFKHYEVGYHNPAHKTTCAQKCCRLFLSLFRKNKGLDKNDAKEYLNH